MPPSPAGSRAGETGLSRREVPPAKQRVVTTSPYKDAEKGRKRYVQELPCMKQQMVSTSFWRELPPPMQSRAGDQAGGLAPMLS